jgi:hypothetical protein
LPVGSVCLANSTKTAYSTRLSILAAVEQAIKVFALALPGQFNYAFILTFEEMAVAGPSSS